MLHYGKEHTEEIGSMDKKRRNSIIVFAILLVWIGATALIPMLSPRYDAPEISFKRSFKKSENATLVEVIKKGNVALVVYTDADGEYNAEIISRNFRGWTSVKAYREDATYTGNNEDSDSYTVKLGKKYVKYGVIRHYASDQVRPVKYDEIRYYGEGDDIVCVWLLTDMTKE